METQAFDTKPLLRPAQFEEATSELKALEAKLYDKNIEDKSAAIQQFRRVSKTVADQTPQPPKDAAEEGRMVARSEALLADILPGMPSQEEMRKAPPGAVDKHMAWERRNKAKILEWKNLRLRLTHGQEPEAANLERHRPRDSTLNMDNAYISGRSFHMPETTGPAVIFDDEELAILRKHAPNVALELATLSNAQRTEVKNVLRGFREDQAQAA